MLMLPVVVLVIIMIVMGDIARDEYNEGNFPYFMLFLGATLACAISIIFIAIHVSQVHYGSWSV